MNGRQKTTVLVLGTVLSVLLMLVVLPTVLPHGEMTVGFAGFRQYEGKTQALYWLTNGSHAAIWQLDEFGRKEGNAWIREDRTRTWLYETIPALPPEKSYLIDPPGFVRLIGFEVATTNAPLRLTLRCQERSPGVLGLWEYGEQAYRQRVRRLSVLVLNGRQYVITNECNGNGRK